jgi:Tfp pilus assembly protein PilV
MHLHRREHRAGRARQGMVLFEVVIALFIFTLVAFSLVMALNSAFDAAMDRNEIDMAIRGLDNQMVLLHSARVLPGENDLPDDGSGILYHVAITQEQMQDQKHQPVPNMYRATITATWKSRGETEERDVTELIYQP